MAQINELISKILLRNDSKENWESKNPTLMKGEAGVEFVPAVEASEGVEAKEAEINIKIGDGVTPWSGLPYALNVADILAQIPDVDLSTVTNNVQVVAAYDALVAGKAVGDIGIVEAPLYEGSTENAHTAYVWNGSAWAAMDGNYDATNVYFNEDITLAGSYTSVGNVALSSKTLSAKGKTLAEVMQSIFTKELYPTADLPTLTISGLSDTSGEVGSSFTLPTATLTVSDVGSYTYGPATGIEFSAEGLTLAQGAVASATNKKTNATAMVAGNTMTLTAVDNSTLYTDSVITYTFNASGSYTQGAMPVTNLGNDYADVRIAAGTATASAKSAKRTGYRYMFAGGTTSAASSEVVRAFTAKKNSKPTSAGTALEFTAAQGATKVICAYPASWTGTPYFEMFGLAWAENANFSAKSNIQVADARGTVDGELQGDIAYKVYAWELDTPLAAETTKFRVYFK